MGESWQPAASLQHREALINQAKHWRGRSESGACSRNYVMRRDGCQEDLGYIGSTGMEPGVVFVVETPGARGDGAPEASDGAETNRGQRTCIPPG